MAALNYPSEDEFTLLPIVRICRWISMRAAADGLCKSIIKTYLSKREVVDSNPSYMYTYRYIVINNTIAGS